MSKKNKKLSHPLAYHVLKFLVRFVVIFKWRFHVLNKYKIAKDEKVLVLSNHQTDVDPILVHYSFNKFLRPLATDNIFAGKLATRFLRFFGTIAKRKGLTDVASVVEMMRASKNGDNLLIFPEGNRSYGEFQFPIDDNLSQLIKKMGPTLVLYNIHGGFGRYPRMGNKPRRGKFYGEIKTILKYEEYKDMPDDKLNKLIRDTIRVYDSESDNLYKSHKRAEYFERLFFICPKCGSLQSIYSKGNYIKCRKCDLNIEYGEDLKLHSNDASFKFTKLVDWYNYQKDFVSRYDFSKLDIIFSDEHVRLNLSNPYVKKKTIYKNKTMVLTNKDLIVADKSFSLSDIKIASPVSGRKLCFTIENDNYVIKGSKRFNAIKYVFLFNVLDTKMRNEKIDIYYKIGD